MTKTISKQYKNITVNPIAGSLGAEIQNVDLSETISDEIISDVYKALLDFQVIFFRNQKFEPISQKLFAKKIGTPVIYPFVKGLEDYPEITPILKKETDINNFGGIWRITSLAFLFPKVFRDFIYDFIAKNRYNWFGKKDNCMIPTTALKAKFLD